MSYEMKKGKGQLMPNSAEYLAENKSRPTHWGKLMIPDGCKEGDVIKLSAWKDKSEAGNDILRITAQKDGFLETANAKESTNNEESPF